MRPILHADCARARIRRALATPCQVVRERDFKLVGTTVLDVSARGMLIAAELPILTGEEVLVAFRSPSGHRWYDRTATVSRVLHGRRRGDRSRAVGLAFDPCEIWSELSLCHDLRAAPIMAQRGLGFGPMARRT
jgi:hypothetical protein